MEQVCKGCGKPYEATRGNQRYCSYDCIKIIGKCHTVKPDGWVYHGECPQCGKQFEADNKRKYCSSECCKQFQLDKQMRKRKGDDPRCLQCGKALSRRQSKFCSHECNSRYRRGYKGRVPVTDEIVRKRIAERYDQIEYVGGYTHSGCWLTVRCKVCGGEFQFGERGARTDYIVSCPHCREERNKPKLPSSHACSVCGTISKTKQCSSECRTIAARQRSREIEKALYEQTAKPKECKECGKVFMPEYADKRRNFCCDGCGKTYGSREGKRARRARNRNAFVSKVDYREIYNRDNGVCQLCGKKIKGNSVTYNPLCGTLDHIIPIALGGTHEPKNVQLAHHICNTRKGTKPMGEQLRLI